MRFKNSNLRNLSKVRIFNFGLTKLERGAKITPNLIKIGVHAYISNRYLNQLSSFNSDKIDKSAYFQPWFDQSWMTDKITQNIIKISVHAYVSNGYINLHSKLNSKKVDKSASFQPWFDQPWTRAKIALDLIKIDVLDYVSNGYLNLL